MGCIAPSSEKIVSEARAADPSYVTSLRGKVAIVTGPTSGIGEYTAYVLYVLGMRVIMAGRNEDRLKAARERILARVRTGGEEAKLSPEREALSGSAELTPMVLDCSSLRSVQGFVLQFRQLGCPLHLLICNAGIMALPSHTVSPDGYEMQFATNHLGHWALAEMLLDVMRASAPSRIICVSSKAHNSNNFEVQKPDVAANRYNDWHAYGNSKLCNVLHAMALADRLQGTGVTAYSLHPGLIASDLGRNNGLAGCFYSGCRCCMKNLTQGAACQVYLAVMPDSHVAQHNGRFFMAPGQPAAPHALATLANAQVLDEVSRRYAAPYLTCTTPAAVETPS